MLRKLSLEIRPLEESERLRHKNWKQDIGETWEPTMPSGTSHTLTHTPFQLGRGAVSPGTTTLGRMPRHYLPAL